MTSLGEHTLGINCRHAPVHRLPHEDGLPPVNAQYFYASINPIDDPLSAKITASAKSTRPGKFPLRPFAQADNIALEKAWLGLSSGDDRQRHESAREDGAGSYIADSNTRELRKRMIEALALKHEKIHRAADHDADQDGMAAVVPTMSCCSELLLDIAESLARLFCAVVRHRASDLDSQVISQDVLTLIRARRSHDPELAGADSAPVADMTSPRSDEGFPRLLRRSDLEESPRGASSHGPLSDPKPLVEHSRNVSTTTESTPILKPTSLDDGISGMPFLRVQHEPHTTVGSPPPEKLEEAVASPVVASPAVIDSEPSFADSVRSREDPRRSAATQKAEEALEHSVEVTVGVSRLHTVSLPMLQMKPIYWSPVNDMAVVTRATWFYKDTMLPLPPGVANQVEAGYLELRPWTETWRDELRCAVDVGPAGEEKVSHRLWPHPSNPNARPESDLVGTPLISSDPFCAARCFHGDASAEGLAVHIPPTETTAAAAGEATALPFANYHVIYKNETEAFLLKPSLVPSAYYGRRSVQKITKGINVGIHLVRGFDRHHWDRIYNKEQPRNSKTVLGDARKSQPNTATSDCSACRSDDRDGRVTDLVLVAHGIGQKFAERVESFHFTHAINDFRRSVNVELQHPDVKKILRDDHQGIMVLPLNWRAGLSFEDGGPMAEDDRMKHAAEGLNLKDIEPKTIPAVRSMISDVMFDIPFYMSHHKNKMISALVNEANRVYRLWCQNNPAFSGKGRVHLIGHSLGSAMAVEILSRQPTHVPRMQRALHDSASDFFEFDTTNLFLAGSPAAFFLLLERGALLPRSGRPKPDADPADVSNPEVVGEAGTYGCIAVDNVYNILAKEDPIAYLLNGAIDPHYASGLQQAHLPSTATSFLKSFQSSFRNTIPGFATAAKAQDSTDRQDEQASELASSSEEDVTARPLTQRLPSQLELEVHDFTREETAERKAYLLNDNGQIDYFLRSSGGPLEIQYLNMLSAHTSYWTNGDFIRMLCVECGRQPGRRKTVKSMRAVKMNTLAMMRK